ncbi:hypothetical protein IF2G_07043 [Cordyceps javanica]|nr:hypothetical protein IF2G_07043 [Cordyceps javanica]
MLRRRLPRYSLPAQYGGLPFRLADHVWDPCIATTSTHGDTEHDCQTCLNILILVCRVSGLAAACLPESFYTPSRLNFSSLGERGRAAG